MIIASHDDDYTPFLTNMLFMMTMTMMMIMMICDSDEDDDSNIAGGSKRGQLWVQM